MKIITKISLFILAIIALGACHYGQNRQESKEINQKYWSTKIPGQWFVYKSKELDSLKDLVILHDNAPFAYGTSLTITSTPGERRDSASVTFFMGHMRKNIIEKGFDFGLEDKAATKVIGNKQVVFQEFSAEKVTVRQLGRITAFTIGDRSFVFSFITDRKSAKENMQKVDSIIYYFKPKS